jgi:hypothetical protein
MACLSVFYGLFLKRHCAGRRCEAPSRESNVQLNELILKFLEGNYSLLKEIRLLLYLLAG